MLQIKLMDDVDLFVAHQSPASGFDEHVELTFVDVENEDYVVRLDATAAANLALSLLVFLQRDESVSTDLVTKAVQELMS